MKLSIGFSIAFLSGGVGAISLRGLSSQEAPVYSASAGSVDGPFDILKCTITAFSDEEKCSDAVTADGNPCDYCTVESQGQEAGVCVTPELADRMKKINPDVSCKEEKTELEDDYVLDLTSSKCTLSAFTDPEKCAEIVDESCEYCSIERNGRQTGLCVSVDMASKLEQFSDKVSCTTMKAPDADTVASASVGAVDGPFDVLKCTIKAFSNKEKCYATTTVDGSPCDYCTINSPSGLCVAPDIAESMKQQNPDVSCTTVDDNDDTPATTDDEPKPDDDGDDEIFDDQEPITDDKPDDDGDDEIFDDQEPTTDDRAATDDQEPSTDDKPDDDGDDAIFDDQEPTDDTPDDLQDMSSLKCTLSAFTDPAKCADVDDSCEYCSIDRNGEEAGLCVNTDMAVKLEQFSNKVSCSAMKAPEDTVPSASAGITVDGPFDFSDFKCTISAFNDPQSCLQTTTADESPCAYCKVKNHFNDHGLCLGPDQAHKLMDGTDKITCLFHENLEVYTSFKKGKKKVNNPVVDCNLKGVDHNTCVDPSLVDGSNCVWCEAGIGGFCFPETWSDSASRFLDCTSDPEESKEEETSSLSGIFSSCLKGKNDAECAVAEDTSSGQGCVWCEREDTALGLCVSPNEANYVHKFMNCEEYDSRDGNVGAADITMEVE